jgi:hypothetical protein
VGDADNDGLITVLDATAIQRYLAEIPMASFNSTLADCDGDNVVTIFDATGIQRHLAELSCSERIGKPV